ncbi:hypothetical protein [Streptomyces lunalinharesii]|uniref:Uncharacterized protein n=1 Tax=Streptomyces lunalinharesii TaxID=333384 RepID=A0ABP6FFM3_9ACTN
MDTMQQHLLDSYRAAQRGEAAPPAPGEATVRTVREIRQWRRFKAVVTDPAERWWGSDGRIARGLAARLARRVRPLDDSAAAPVRPAPSRPVADREAGARGSADRATTALAGRPNAGASDA